MIVNAAIQKLLNCKFGDEIISCNAQDYYNASSPQFQEVCDIVKDNGKLIILTR